MDQQVAVAFYKVLMKNFRLTVRQFDAEHVPDFDMGLRASLGVDIHAFVMEGEVIREKVIYLIEDMFGMQYLLLRLDDGEYLLTGPFLREEMTDAVIMARMEKNSMPASLLPLLRAHYKQMVIIKSTNVLLTAASSLGEMLWGTPDAFTVRRMVEEDLIVPPMYRADPREIHIDSAQRRAIELRYETESKLIYAIAHGQLHQAGVILSAFHPGHMENRSPVPLRNIKNYAIICNTLMRKAAEQGGVHPLYIDRLSSSIAYKIEQILTVEEGHKFIFQMLHKYCLLVRNHTMKRYSQPVQGVILRVDTEIDGDLSLSAHARHLGVNASYLSALFKKETGMTITDYVNRARIEHSLFLLNSTDMMIQTIAQHCGVPDVNYFTRMFRRLIGKTPSEYRRYTRNTAPQD